jgi:small GTP-binding protein
MLGYLIQAREYDRRVYEQVAETPPGLVLRQVYEATVLEPTGSVAWSPNGELFAGICLGANGYRVNVWRMGEPEPAYELSGPDECHDLAWAPTSQNLVVGYETHVSIQSFDGSESRQIGETTSELQAVAWHPRGGFVAAADWDGVVHVWDSDSGELLRRISDINPVVANLDLAWSPDGKLLVATGQAEGAVRVWNFDGSRLLWTLESGVNFHQALSWLRDDTHFVVGTQDRTVLVVDRIAQGVRQRLEGYADSVESTSVSADGVLLASTDRSGLVRLWDTRDWTAGPTFHPIWEPGAEPIDRLSRVAFHPTAQRLIIAGATMIAEWDVDTASLLRARRGRTVKLTSAKVVLVGESNVGKSTLAMRLAEDHYPTDEEQSTTHGMRFWHVDAEDLHPSLAAPLGEHRDIVLWDFGGQHEYRLVHQLFLSGTTIALVLFDPTRGLAEIDAARDWSARLERQLSNGEIEKLLIGAKQDHESELVDRRAIDRLVLDGGFADYLEVSAKTERNIDALRVRLAATLEWDRLAMTSRPEIFEIVQKELEACRDANVYVLLLADLLATMQKRVPDLFDKNAVRAAAEHLSLQGVIAQTTLTDGGEALVLQVPVIERYAGSLIVAARNNPRGVPALEERLLGSRELPLPGMDTSGRLDESDERIVLECVVEMMIRHGLCLRHAGLLIFPALFPDESEADTEIEHSVSLFYDFTGPIDNVYASLVAQLMMTEQFGDGRLYARRAEFDSPGDGVCGVRRSPRAHGSAHLDLFFSENTEQDRRDLFARFVAGHLHQHGVIIRERQAIECRTCHREISEEAVQANVVKGFDDVVCSFCRATTKISEGVVDLPATDRSSAKRLVALRAEVRAQTDAHSKRVKAAVRGRGARTHEGPIHLLHLSDLHFTAQTAAETKAQWLLQDLRDAFGDAPIEYLVISGDVTDRGNPDGLERGREFVHCLTEALALSAERCIFVPGNHDIEDREDAFDFYMSESRALEANVPRDRWQVEGTAIFVPSARYCLRLESFSKAFFHKILQVPYPNDEERQGLVFLFPETGVQFLTLNSCWEIDNFNRKRASVHPSAVAHAIMTADRQVKEAIAMGRLADDAPILRIGVWHHAVQHPEMMRDPTFMENLQKAGVQLALHGDVHEINRDQFHYWDPRRIHVAGAGSFGSPAAGRPESTPRLYNLIAIDRTLGSARVHTRRQRTPDAPWEPWNEWPRPDSKPGALPYYDLTFTP